MNLIENKKNVFWFIIKQYIKCNHIYYVKIYTLKYFDTNKRMQCTRNKWKKRQKKSHALFTPGNINENKDY